jgi:restriction system protein
MGEPTAKHKLLRELALRRSSCTPSGYHAIAEYHDGAYECEHVSPYTKSAGNVDSPIFVMLQDWLSHNVALKWNPDIRRLGRNPRLDTNRNLDELLANHLRVSVGKIYATNLFPFVKPGGMSARVHGEQLRSAASEFGLPQIRVVQPRLVIALGLEVFRALAFAIGQIREPTNIDEAIRTPFTHNGTRIWCQAHTGYWGQHNRRKLRPSQVEADWSNMAAWYFASGKRAA